jgi:ferredoxin
MRASALSLEAGGRKGLPFECGRVAPGLPDGRHHGTDRNSAVKVQINSERCQGHGRCYDLAPGLFGDDDEGYGMVLGDGTVPPGKEHDARLAAVNCPERAIELLEEV